VKHTPLLALLDLPSVGLGPDETMDPGLAEMTAVELEGHQEQVHIPHLSDRSPGRIGMFSLAVLLC